MFDVYKIRKDFPMLNNKIQQGHPLVYLDNAATTFKPYKVDSNIDKVRQTVANFINAKKEEIVFTSGTSMSINLIAFGYGMKYLTKDDEILLTEAEHASNVLPWFKVKEHTGCKINYIPLDKDGRLSIEGLKKVINKHTKIVAIAQISNVLAYLVDIKEISKICHEHGALLMIDGAQSVPHIKIDVKDLDCDFLSFSGHKLCGPTGIGVLYGKYNLLKLTDPFMTGGGNNARFDMCGNVAFLQPPEKFEAGTLNIEGIYGLGAAIEYLENIGMENIEIYEKELRNYAISKLKTLQNLIIYNEFAEGSIITINVKDVFAQDEASYLNSKGICVRSGEHCAKILHDFLKTVATVRISFSFYNTKEEIDILYEALKNGGDFLDAYFN